MSEDDEESDEDEEDDEEEELDDEEEEPLVELADSELVLRICCKIKKIKFCWVRFQTNGVTVNQAGNHNRKKHQNPMLYLTRQVLSLVIYLYLFKQMHKTHMMHEHITLEHRQWLSLQSSRLTTMYHNDAGRLRMSFVQIYYTFVPPSNTGSIWNVNCQQ